MSRLRTWARDLFLGLQLAFRGARMRTALTAIGIGLGVGVLLFAASLPGAISAREDRQDARSIWTMSQAGPADSNGDFRPRITDDTARVAEVTTIWKSQRVSGALIDPDGTSPPLPPGLRRIPAEGEIVVSPALAELLRQPGAELLRQRLGGGEVVGTIRPGGLNGPGERFWYGNSDLGASLVGGPESVNRIDRFGSDAPAAPLDAFTRLLVLVGAVVLLFPIAILVATAARFGSERRDRRLAALRLVGTSRRETARIAAGESLAAALLGIAGGALLFALARQTLNRVEAYGFSLYPKDVNPDPVLTTVILAGVLVVTIATTVLSMRRISVEPLAVARRGRSIRRRVWWRPIPTLAGFALLAPLTLQSPEVASEQPWQIGIGAVLVLTGTVALLPWLVDATVGRLRSWSIGSQLAVRTLQSDGAASARIVSGVAVAVAGAIALQMLIAAEATDTSPAAAAAAAGQRHTAGVYFAAPIAEIPRIRAALEATPGVRSADLVATHELQSHGQRSGVIPMLVVGDCRALAELAAIRGCDDRVGGVYRAETAPGTAPNGPGESTRVPVAGERVKAGPYWEQHWPRFRLPSVVPTVRPQPDSDGRVVAGIYATPGAVPLRPDALADLRGQVRLDPGDALALERLRTAATRVSPLASVYESTAESDAATTSAIRRVLMAGATLLLMLIAASLLVTTLEQLGERRRSLATLAAFGTPRSVLRRALWWQTAIPIAIGLGLAVVIGTTLGALLLAPQDVPVRLDLAGTAGLLALGAGLVVIVTATALPLLRRVASPSAMRTE